MVTKTHNQLCSTPRKCTLGQNECILKIPNFVHVHIVVEVHVYRLVLW